MHSIFLTNRKYLCEALYADKPNDQAEERKVANEDDLRPIRGPWRHDGLSRWHAVAKPSYWMSFQSLWDRNVTEELDFLD